MIVVVMGVSGSGRTTVGRQEVAASRSGKTMRGRQEVAGS